MKKLLIAVMGMAAATVTAQDCAWIGGESGSWNQTANWSSSGGGIPGAGDKAVFSSPVTITDGIAISGGTLEIVRNADVMIQGVISGAGGLKTSGAGALHLSADNSFSGGLTVVGPNSVGAANDDKGSVYVHNGGALGVGLATIDTRTGPRLYVDGGLRVKTEIALTASAVNNTGYLSFASPGSVTFEKAITSTGKLYLYGDNSTDYYFNGKVTETDYSFGTGIFHFVGGISFATYRMGASAHFYSSTDKTANWFALAGSDAYLHGKDTLPHGGSSGATWEFYSSGSVIHMNGFDQSLSGVTRPSTVSSWQRFGAVPNSKTHGFESPDNQPALLTLTFTGENTESWWGVFSGAAGLDWLPSNVKGTFCFSNTVQTTCGMVKVRNGIVKVTTGAGFTRLGTLDVARVGRFEVEPSASSIFVTNVVVAEGGKIKISKDRTVECVSAKFGNNDELTQGYYSAVDFPDYIEGEGCLVVTSGRKVTWKGGATGSWSQGSNWSSGEVPQAGEVALIDSGASISVSGSTAALSELRLVNGSLVMSGWDTFVEANQIRISANGKITTTGSFTTGDTSGDNNPPARVYLKCGDLLVAKGGKIDVKGQGWQQGFGPGAVPNDGSSVYCASHGGHGVMMRSNSALTWTPTYDDPLAPTYPGSSRGTAGGGAIRIIATGKVTVDGSIDASAGDGTSWSGAGGSVWISCATFCGDGGEVRADGGRAGQGVFPVWYWWYRGGESGNDRERAGGGGMVRIEYGAGQSAVGDVKVAVSALEGIHEGLTVADHDKYWLGADMGTVTFSDNVLLAQLLGKGLSGKLVGVEAFTYDGDLNWTSGHVRFPGTDEAGADVTVNGDLTLSGTGSRLEIGGVETRHDRNVFMEIYGGRFQNKLTVNGDMKLLSGAAFDIRAAETNDVIAWGGRVKTTGGLLVGAGSIVRPWCDIETLGAPCFEVGGDFTVESGAAVDASWRGGRGGRGGPTWKAYFGLADTKESGCGIGASEFGGGSSHGGLGGVGWADVNGGSIVRYGTAGSLADDEWTASLPGAGGGSAGIAEGGAGGGLVYVEAAGAVRVDGTISADGGTGLCSDLGLATRQSCKATFIGNGAGGGVHLAGSTFAGCGTITARGGDCVSGTLAGTGDGAGSLFSYAQAAGGGGRVVIATCVDVRDSEPNVKIIKADSVASPRYAKLADRIAFTGHVDVSGGIGIWNVKGQTGNAPQFAESCGSDGTVRYVGWQVPGGLIMVVR